jgi:hypothetical protein
MKVKEDDIIWLTIVAIVSGCVVILAILAALIMMRFEEPSPPVIQGSVLIGVGSLVLVVLWFLIKALVAHTVGHWAFKRVSAWWRNRRAPLDDDELDVEINEEWIKKARLTRPGESLIEKENDK